MEANETPKPKTSAAAVSSLVTGILGCIPFVTSLAAVILGIIGIKKTGNPMVKGRGMAIAGLILGVLGLIGWAGFAATVVGAIAVLQAGQPARAVGEQFAKNVSEGKIDEALALSAEGTDKTTLTALSEKIKPWGALQLLTLTSVEIKTDNQKSVYTIGGVASFATGAKMFKMTLNKEGETYKVVTCDFNSLPGQP